MFVKALLLIAVLFCLGGCGGNDHQPAQAPADPGPAPRAATPAADDPPEDTKRIAAAAPAPSAAGATPSQPSSPASAAQPALMKSVDPRPLSIQAGPIQNPMKGWNATWGDAQPGSSVSHRYIAWRQLQPRDQESFLTKPELEKSLGLSQDTRHLVLRVYLQWFGNDSDSPRQKLPDWVLQKQPQWVLNGVQGPKVEERKARIVLDYNNTELQAQMDRVVAKLAEYFDNDPRVYAIQLGLVGYFGEWHNFNWFSASDTKQPYVVDELVRLRLYKSFDRHFKNKLTMGRYADQFAGLPQCEAKLNQDAACASPRLGHHNDSFKFREDAKNKSDAAVAEHRLYLRGPMGGEPKPENKGEDLYLDPAASQKLVRTLGYSTMSDAHYHPDKAIETLQKLFPATAFDRAQLESTYWDMHRFFGYNFRIDRIQIPQFAAPGSLVPIELEGKNVGVAPFYYPWNLEIAVLNDKNTVIASSRLPEDIRKIKPEDAFRFQGTVRLPDTLALDQTLTAVVRIAQPGATVGKPLRTENVPSGCASVAPSAAGGFREDWGGLDARNAHIQFVNQLDLIPGQWTAHDCKKGWGHVLTGGWTKLGQFKAERRLAPGLRTVFLNGLGSTAVSVLTRRDAEVNFDWGLAAPAPGVAADHFEVRWSGYLYAEADGVYTFQVESNDGARLTIGDQEVVSQWRNGIQSSSGQVRLEKGNHYNLRMEVYERTGNSWARLKWMPPGATALIIVPGKHLWAE